MNAYRRWPWAARRAHQVLRGVDLSLAPGRCGRPLSVTVGRIEVLATAAALLVRRIIRPSTGGR